MNTNKNIRRLIAGLLAVGLLLGCGGGEPSPETVSNETSLTVTDMAGQTVEFPEPVTRVVAVAAADCEILYAVGAGDTLVGRGEYCDYPAETAQVPSVESGTGLNTEQILALAPQVVIMPFMGQTLEQVNALKSAGIRVVSTNAQDIEGVYTAIELIGRVVGRDENAAALIAEMKDAFREVSSQGAAVGKKIYFEVSPLEWGLWTAGSNTFMNEIAGIIGLENIFADLDGWCEVSEEQVLQRNPDYIITITPSVEGQAQTPEEEIMNRGGWETVSAVQNRQVFIVDSDSISRPGPRLKNAAQEIRDRIYGF